MGAQVTVAGMVRRPAIYELRNEQSLDQALDLAGGVLVSGALGNVKVERIQAHERKVLGRDRIGVAGSDGRFEPLRQRLDRRAVVEVLVPLP